MDHIPRASEFLYVGVCRELGTPTKVTFRRDLYDTAEMIGKPSELYQGLRRMLSGSHREGFRFKSSDRDFMYWFPDHKVICEMSQSTFYHPPRHTLIYMETSDTPPGFARLQLLTPSSRQIVINSLLERSDIVYISSSLLRLRHHQSISGHNPTVEGENLHGPCHNYTHLSYEFDLALCFHSLHCPLPALPWVERCLTRSWPSHRVLQSIIDEGFHLVPIAHKQTNELNSDLEWRISFSQAEQKLVYSMNHCQFLCYGIMKIFLKEILPGDLLCSYFMKTILFWRIQESSSTPWIPSTLLQHVWFCFKSLMQCVYTGYLPNFFIPENNMFAGKFVEGQQISLYQKLEKFYKMGFAFLLHSPTLREILIPAISNPYFVMQTGESYLKSEIDIDIAFHLESNSVRNYTKESDFLLNMMQLNVIDQLFSTCHNVVLHQALISVLLFTSMSLKTHCLSVSKKRRYTIDRSIIHMLSLVQKLGCVSDGLYLAFYLYDTGRYQTALTVTDRVKQRLSQPFIMYHYSVDRQRYSEAVGGQSMLTKYRKAWARNVAFDKEFTYIEELRLEQEVSEMNEIMILFLSPFVSVHMLSVLCHYRLGNRSQYLQALTDLYTLLHYDDGRYVDLEERDLSWQILGICQHVVGDLHGALQSYQESLRQIPYHKIQTATETRINSLNS